MLPVWFQIFSQVNPTLPFKFRVHIHKNQLSFIHTSLNTDQATMAHSIFNLSSKAFGCTAVVHRLMSMLILMHAEAPGEPANILQHYGNSANQDQNQPIQCHLLESAQQDKTGIDTYGPPISNSTVRKREQFSQRSS